MGAHSSALTLSTAPQNILTAIGSAYTGDVVNYGHNISYSLLTKQVQIMLRFMRQEQIFYQLL